MALLLWAFCLAVPAAPAHADPGRYLSSPAYAELTSELNTLQSSPGAPTRTLNAEQQRRLADLSALNMAIAASDDRAQILNATHHSIGVFARYKKELPSTPATFYLLGPGHETNDDFELVGLYVPAGVALAWGDGGGGAAITAGARIAPVLDGQTVCLTDPVAPASSAAASLTVQANQTPEAVTSALNLPVFSLDTRREGVATLPALSQVELDRHPETALLD